MTTEQATDMLNDTDNPRQNALQRVEAQDHLTAAPKAETPVLTPTEARNGAIAHALDAAYAKASTLQLTPDEAKALSEDFPDEAFRLGAGGDPNLLYIEHAYLRERLNHVLGIGSAVPIRRREWAEEFKYFKDNRDKIGVRVYVDMVLLVRGCVVGEAIGDSVYYPDNAKTNYSDALEGAKSNAFRRCAKEFGVGLQVWKKGYCEGWHQRAREAKQPQRPKPAPKTPPAATVEPKKATAASVLPAKATEKTREWAWHLLFGEFNAATVAEFLHSKEWLDETGTWNLDRVPTSRQALAALADEIRKTLPQDIGAPEPEPMRDGERAESWSTTGGFDLEPPTAKLGDESRASSPTFSAEPADELPPEWADVVFSLPPKGVPLDEWLSNPLTIGQMYRGTTEDKKRLFAFAKGDWIPEGRGKNPPSREDIDCRNALDLMLEWRTKQGKD